MTYTVMVWRKQCTFDLKFGFFVCMGGLEMWHRNPEGDEALRTLSPAGVRELAKVNIEPLKVSRSLILDRSKADTIQKALVLLQVSWMAIQCIARKAYGLPLTLLELHTMVHVVCAAALYGFWFEVRFAFQFTSPTSSFLLWAVYWPLKSSRVKSNPSRTHNILLCTEAA